MGLTPEQIKDWAKKTNKFLKIEDGETVTFTLNDAKTITKDSFGTEKEVMRYNVTMPDGSKKIYEVGSPSLNALLADYLGREVTLSRAGTGTNTKYAVLN